MVKRKGINCSRVLPCSYHTINKIVPKKEKKIIKPIKSNIVIIPKVCKVILKSGPRKGQQCNQKLNCKYHKEKTIPIYQEPLENQENIIYSDDEIEEIEI
jgi:hypothetical protein